MGSERRPASLLVPLTVLGIIALAATLAPWLAAHDPNRPLDVVALKNAVPSAAHPLGTDAFSRDVWSRLLHGSRTSLLVAALGAGLAIALSVVIGALTALPTPMARLLLALVEALRAIPRKLLLLAGLLLVPAPGPFALAALVGALSWMGLAQIVHTRVQGTLAEDYIVSARALGVPPARLFARHLLPHLSAPLGAAGALLVSDILAVEAGITFLGLGIRPPTPSWGAMLQDGVPYLATAWWTTVAPVMLLVATVLSLARLADALDDDRAYASLTPQRRR